MCLLEQVEQWDEQGITCSALSHTDAHNPLREGEQLPITAGIEYAAQAMAIHGSLNRPADNGAPRVGYLAVLSRVSWQVPRLDTLTGPLTVRAEQQMATADGSNYEFFISHQGQTILSGLAVVALANN